MQRDEGKVMGPNLDQVPTGQTGDIGAQQELWRAHRRWVAAIILAHRPRSVEVDDLMQEVALKLVDAGLLDRDKPTREDEARVPAHPGHLVLPGVLGIVGGLRVEKVLLVPEAGGLDVSGDAELPSYADAGETRFFPDLADHRVLGSLTGRDPTGGHLRSRLREVTVVEDEELERTGEGKEQRQGSWRDDEDEREGDEEIERAPQPGLTPDR